MRSLRLLNVYTSKKFPLTLIVSNSSRLSEVLVTDIDKLKKTKTSIGFNIFNRRCEKKHENVILHFSIDYNESNLLFYCGD